MPHKIRGKCLIGNIEKLPRTVDEAVERLIREYSLEDKTNIANMTENELMTLSLLFNRYSMWVYVYSICTFENLNLLQIFVVDAIWFKFLISGQSICAFIPTNFEVIIFYNKNCESLYLIRKLGNS